MISITVDLRYQFGPARNQGARPTCLAFAASDAHAHAQNTNEYLSAEYAHFSATRRRTPPRPELAATLPSMIAAIREDGQPLETAWPYLVALPSPLSDYQPPPDLGSCFRHTFTETPPRAEQILETLNAGQPALLGLRITRQFHYPPPDGIIRLMQSDPPTANHAVLCVGWGTIATSPVFLVRNSWGEQWANAGHIWLTDDYVRAQLLVLAHSANGVPTQ